MTESEFNDLVDETFETLEEALDDVDADLDVDSSGGVLTVQFENGSTMVFSRQPPTCELWLASRSGGYHFAYDETSSDWRDTRTDAPFKAFVVEQMKSQGGVDLNWT